MPPTSEYEVFAEHFLVLVVQMSALKNESKEVKAKQPTQNDVKLRK